MVELGVVVGWSSSVLGRFECMFDDGGSGIADLTALTDAQLVDAAGGWARA